MNVLLIEDNVDLANSVINYLKLRDIDVDHAHNAELGLDMVRKNNYRCCVLDINLPGTLDGYQFCEKIRSFGVSMPIMMMTARSNIQDKLTGFSCGADDFVTKPINLAELTARINVLSGRKNGEIKYLTFGSLTMDFNKHEVSSRGQKLVLTPKSWKILETLLRHAPHAVKKEYLEISVWGKSPPFSGSLKVHLYNIRKALEQSAVKDVGLKTVRDYGVKLTKTDQKTTN